MCRRECHSVSSVTLNINTVWIIVTGGRRDLWSIIAIEGVEVAMVVELG